MLCKFGAVPPPPLNLSCLCHRELSGTTLLTMVSVPNKFFKDHKEMKEMLHPFFSFLFFCTYYKMYKATNRSLHEKGLWYILSFIQC